MGLFQSALTALLIASTFTPDSPKVLSETLCGPVQHFVCLTAGLDLGRIIIEWRDSHACIEYILRHYRSYV